VIAGPVESVTLSAHQTWIGQKSPSVTSRNRLNAHTRLLGHLTVHDHHGDSIVVYIAWSTTLDGRSAPDGQRDHGRGPGW
jgi:hypothetical protein